MPTIKQKKAFDKSLENHGNITQAMRDAGYSEATINNPKDLTESDGWKELMETYLPRVDIAKKHKELLNSVVLEKFDFSLKISDESIKETVESAGGKFIHIESIVTTEPMFQRKTAYYTTPNPKAVKDALDMAYKLRGSYAPDKSVTLNLNETIPTERLLEIATRLNETTRALHPGGDIASDGTPTNVVDAEVQPQNE